LQVAGKELKLVRVTRIRTTAVLGAVLLWAVTPAMACLLPGFAPTPAEQECCHHMANHCGQSAMPASHACCHAPSRPETVVVQGQASLPLKHVIAAIPAIARVCLPNVLSASLARVAFLESPPGETPPRSPSVLRI